MLSVSGAAVDIFHFHLLLKSTVLAPLSQLWGFDTVKISFSSNVFY